MKVGTAVIFNGGGDDEHCVALVEHVHSKDFLDLITFPWGSSVEHTRSSYPNGVPRREPKDYGPEGGAGTWHPVHT